jgi:hypothetical protein
MSRTPPDPSKSRIARTMGNAKEAMPYIQEFKGKTFVIKYGGSAMADETLRHTFAGDVALLALVGLRPVVVHGGGPHITRAMGQAGVEPQWVDGLRSSGRTVRWRPALRESMEACSLHSRATPSWDSSAKSPQ